MRRLPLHQIVVQPMRGFVYFLLTVLAFSSPLESITIAQEQPPESERDEEKKNAKTDRQKFIEQLEAFEQKVAEIEELGKYGHPEV